MSSLDFPHTCPTIDNVIRYIDGYLEDALSDVIDDVAPLISEANKSLYLKKAHKDYFDLIKDEIETLRNLNSDMRAQAEDQLERLASEILDLTGDIERLEVQVDELEDQVKMLSDGDI